MCLVGSDMWQSLWWALTVILITKLQFCNSNEFESETGEPNGVIVHLFEWKFEDVAKECINFLGPYGFAGVQVSPVTENIILEGRPWTERYQPISYKIVSRSGSENAFHNMVQSCRAAGVKVYVDVVLNHMTATFEGNEQGTGASFADTEEFYYPEVPYTEDDFNQPTCSIEDWKDPVVLRECESFGRHDLNLTRPYVRSRLRKLLNKLISYGVAGFRVDAVEYMWPSDLQAIFSRLNYLNDEEGFDYDMDAYIYQDFSGPAVGDGVTASEYYELGRITDYKYALDINYAFRNLVQLKTLQTIGGSKWEHVDSNKAIVFIDTIETQRGYGFGGTAALTHETPKSYIMAVAFMLAWPHGQPLLMSSYSFDDIEQGPPTNKYGKIADVQFTKEGTCTNGWVCEHRWRQIYNMVEFRNVVGDSNVTGWWDNKRNQIGFSRGDKGFIVFNADNYNINKPLKTTLPEGTYCDIISGELVVSMCTGKTVTVDSEGYAKIHIKTIDEDGVMAIHINSKLK